MRSVPLEQVFQAVYPLQADLLGRRQKIERVAIVVVENGEDEVSFVQADRSFLQALSPHGRDETATNLIDVLDSTWRERERGNVFVRRIRRRTHMLVASPDAASLRSEWPFPIGRDRIGGRTCVHWICT